MVKDERNFIFLVISQPCRAEVSAIRMTRVSNYVVRWIKKNAPGSRIV